MRQAHDDEPERAPAGRARPGVRAARGRSPRRTPTAMTQPRTDIGPIIRLDRDEARVAMAHERAAPRPPTIATIEASVTAWTDPGRLVTRVTSATIRVRVRRPIRARAADTIRSRGSHRLGQNAPQMDRRTLPVGPEACPQLRAAPRGPRPAPRHREDARPRAVDVATSPGDQDPQASLAAAMSALDRAAKTGAIHPNAAARRKSRLALKVNDLLAGTTVIAKGKAKSVGKAAGAEGRQGPHRRRQGRQGEGRPDRRRQGPRRAQQDHPRRGRASRDRPTPRRRRARRRPRRPSRPRSRRRRRRRRREGQGLDDEDGREEVAPAAQARPTNASKRRRSKALAGVVSSEALVETDGPRRPGVDEASIDVDGRRDRVELGDISRQLATPVCSRNDPDLPAQVLATWTRRPRRSATACSRVRSRPDGAETAASGCHLISRFEQCRDRTAVRAHRASIGSAWTPRASIVRDQPATARSAGPRVGDQAVFGTDGPSSGSARVRVDVGDRRTDIRMSKLTPGRRHDKPCRSSSLASELSHPVARREFGEDPALSVPMPSSRSLRMLSASPSDRKVLASRVADGR